ncbi:Thioredoxin-related protein [Dyadobacter sp. SG02]|uniref:thioredoxin family protein n=1 Tax=Dyadobacter sp. SG02 TaxID=1855291 RepID=UPI0008C02FBE|nr:thioredoxin fold domain-containing protein [Dyadobacter sp. SG02]SEI54413.1 Thioredoxin-related protein [Dyadobacter sp. SG02]
MKKPLYLILLIFCATICRAQSIAFTTTSWDEAVQNAGKSGKQIFVYAQTKSCRFCRQMEKEVFTDKNVVDYYNANFINYKIDIEDGGAGEALSKQHGIVGFPTYLYFDKKGEKLHQSSGFKPADDFIRDGRNASDPHTALFSMLATYNGGEKSPELLFNLSKALKYYMVDNNPKEKVTDEYLSTQPANALGSEKNLRFIFETDLDFKSTATQYLLQNQEKFIPLFGKPEVEKRAQRIMTGTAGIAGRQNDLILMSGLRKVAAGNFADSIKMLSLVQIYFYGGREDWLNYAKSTLKYGNTIGAADWQTMYETGAYLNYFAKDRETLSIGAEIMSKVVNLNRTYDHLRIYAQLQKKAGNKELALKAAEAALQISNEKGESGDEARELIEELTKK